MGEPWVALADERSLRHWDKAREIEYNQTLRQTEKHRFYQLAFDFLTENHIPGDYWEFGCHRARTFRMALTEARKHNLRDMSFYAFDSFEGLPEPAEPSNVVGWNKGALSTSEDEFRRLIDQHGIYPDRVQTVKGFYRDTLRKSEPTRNAAMVTIDCDLHGSATDVLRYIEGYLQPGCVLYVDDYFSGYAGQSGRGVRAAFDFWREQRTDHVLTEFLPVGWWGKSYLVDG